MRGRLATSTLVAAAIIAPASGLAMTNSNSVRESSCRVTGSEKLAAAAVRPDTICMAIERAIAAEAPNARFTVEVAVVRPSMLTAALVVDGRKLPEQSFAVMDHDLNERSIERFARSIAAAVAKASKH